MEYNIKFLIPLLFLLFIVVGTLIGLLVYGFKYKPREEFMKTCSDNSDCEEVSSNLACVDGLCILSGTRICTTTDTESSPLIRCDVTINENRTSPSPTSPTGINYAPSTCPVSSCTTYLDNSLCDVCSNTPAYTCSYVTFGDPIIIQEGSGFEQDVSYAAESYNYQNSGNLTSGGGMFVIVDTIGTYDIAPTASPTNDSDNELTTGSAGNITITLPGTGYAKNDYLIIYPNNYSDNISDACIFQLTKTPTLYIKNTVNGVNTYLEPSDAAYCLPTVDASEDDGSGCNQNISDTIVNLDEETGQATYTCSCTNPTMFAYNDASPAGNCNRVLACGEQEGTGTFVRVAWQEPNNSSSTVTRCNTNADCSGVITEIENGYTSGYTSEHTYSNGTTKPDVVCCGQTSGGLIRTIDGIKQEQTYGLCLPNDSGESLNTFTNGMLEFGDDDSDKPGFCMIKWSGLSEEYQEFFDPNAGICDCTGNNPVGDVPLNMSNESIITDTTNEANDSTVEALVYETYPILTCQIDTCKPYGTLQFESGQEDDVGSCICQEGYLSCGCNYNMNSSCTSNIRIDDGSGLPSACGGTNQPLCIKDPCAPYGKWVDNERNSGYDSGSGACVCFDKDDTKPNGECLKDCVKNDNGILVPPDNEGYCYTEYCAVQYPLISDDRAEAYSGSSTYTLCQNATTACGEGKEKRGDCYSVKIENDPELPGIFYYMEGCKNCLCPYCNYSIEETFDPDNGVNPNCVALNKNISTDGTSTSTRENPANLLCQNSAGGSCSGETCTGEANPGYVSNQCWNPESTCIYDESTGYSTCSDETVTYSSTASRSCAPTQE